MQKLIDSCIASLKGMLGDTNNELTAEQQRQLNKGIRDLKRLQKAKTLTYARKFAVAKQIADATYDILKSDLSR
jgi:hypothetical protein